MRTEVLDDFDPHPKQEQVLNSAARFKIGTCARRTGKSTLAAHIILEKLTDPGRHQFYDGGKLYTFNHMIWVLAAKRELTAEIWDQVYREVKSWQLPESILKVNISTKTIQYFPTEAKVEFKTGHIQGLNVGRGLTFVVIDEAGVIKDPLVYHEDIEPALADKQGEALIIGTPKFGAAWFRNLYEKGDPDHEKYDEDFFSFYFSQEDNPYLPESAHRLREKKKKELPHDIYLREYEGRWTDEGGLVFRNLRHAYELFNKYSSDWDQYLSFSRTAFILGVDVGSSVDNTAISVFSRKRILDMDLSDKIVPCVEQLVLEQLEYTELVDEIKTVSLKYGSAPLIVDSTGVGGPFLEMLKAKGMIVYGYNFTVQSREDLLQNLQSLFDHKRIAIPPHDTLLEELTNFVEVKYPSGRVKREAASGYHDDTVMSLALGAWAAARARNKISYDLPTKKQRDVAIKMDKAIESKINHHKKFEKHRNSPFWS